MCAPSSVGAMEPVGMTNASTTKARKMKARMNATRIDSTVSLALPSSLPDARRAAATAAAGVGAGAARVARVAAESGIAADGIETAPARVGLGRTGGAGVEARRSIEAFLSDRG